MPESISRRYLKIKVLPIQVKVAKPSESVKERKAPYIEACANAVMAFAAVVTIVISGFTLALTQKTIKAQEKDSQRERFTSALAQLKDDSLNIRLDALNELKQLGLNSPQEQEKIVRALSSFISERIKKEDYLSPKMEEGLPIPNDDVFDAGKIVSLFYTQTGCRADLAGLKAKGIDLSSLQLQGADLRFAQLQGAVLRNANLREANLNEANLREASLHFADLQKAQLSRADLRGAELGVANLEMAYLSTANLKKADFYGALNLSVYQLLNAEIDGTTRFDTELRAEYNRLKAERDGSDEG